MTREQFKALYRAARYIATYDPTWKRWQAWEVACHIHNMRGRESLSCVMYSRPIPPPSLADRLSAYKDSKHFAEWFNYAIDRACQGDAMAVALFEEV